MGIINENQLRNFIKGSIHNEISKRDKDIENLWGYVNELRQEIKMLESQLERVNDV